MHEEVTVWDMTALLSPAAYSSAFVTIYKMK